MPDGIAILEGTHRVRLKWHRLKRDKADVPFTATRLAQGFALGASMEVDLRRHHDHGFAVMHDKALERETTGSGFVRDTPASALRGLKMRNPDGSPTDQDLLLLDDLARLAAASGAPGTLIQLDLKEDSEAIDATTIAAFQQVLAPVADRFILSGGDWQAVTRLGKDLPGLAIGYDPCHDDIVWKLETAAEFGAFVAGALGDAPEASTIYLNYPLVLKADKIGVDLIGLFHAAGKLIDSYTLNIDQPDAAATLRRLIALKTDQITTDQPLAMQAFYESNSTSQA